MQNPKSNINKTASGTVTYGHNIVASIVALAAKEINGVASLHGKGVRLDFSGRSVNVDAYVNVTAGFCCSDIAFRIQENIKRSVETMSEYKVGIINVNVLGVAFTPESDNNI